MLSTLPLEACLLKESYIVFRISKRLNYLALILWMTVEEVMLLIQDCIAFPLPQSSRQRMWLGPADYNVMLLVASAVQWLLLWLLASHLKQTNCLSQVSFIEICLKFLLYERKLKYWHLMPVFDYRSASDLVW